EIHREVCERGYDAERGTFTQYYGSQELDASVLNIPLVGFLPGDDERVTGTIDAVRRELGRDGFVSRYSTSETDDGLAGDEGQFLACSFWLVSALAANGRTDEARELFERLVGLGNDLGLLAEEYDVGQQRQVGNFPQAFSHLTLIGAATAIADAEADGSAGEGDESSDIRRPPEELIVGSRGTALRRSASATGSRRSTPAPSP
ncbi:MAG TPA: glycoside hydrolase family 15 protein, partial [Gaiellaceae bacterium]|nr:glycoside hydrolase family 15 protein [Gaiellaceae bacterium]